MMNEILKIFFSLSVSGSIITLVLFALKPIFKDKFSKTWQYYIWLIVIIRLLLPFSLETNIVGQLFLHADKMITIQNEALQPMNNIPNPADNFIPQSPQINHAETIQPEKAMNYWNEIKNNLWLIWIGIAVMLLVRKVTSYHSFVRYIKAGINQVTDNKVLETFKTTCISVGLKKPLKIYTNPLATSAMLVGVFKPFVVVPDIEFSEKELHNIFIHELTHYKRLDIFYKWFTQLAVCLHWYNPLVYLVSRETNKNCELSCDEMIIRKLDANGKRRYGDTLLASLKFNGNYGDTIVSITLNEDARLLKERLGAIMKFTKKSKLSIALSMVLTAVIFCGATVTGAYAASTSALDNLDKIAKAIPNITPITIEANNIEQLKIINKADNIKSINTLNSSDIDYKGKNYTNGLWFQSELNKGNPESIVEFKLNQNYTDFDGIITLKNTSKNVNNHISFEILGDGKQLYYIANVDIGTLAVGFGIYTSSVDTLTLKITLLENEKSNVTVDWGVVDTLFKVKDGVKMSEQNSMKIAKFDSKQFYLVENEEDLRAIGSGIYSLSENYMLNADITLTKDWITIGNDDNPFMGRFEGNGYTITNMKITDKDLKYVGLFGYVKGGIIHNVTLANIDIENAGGPNNIVAPIAGFVANGGEVTDCKVVN